MSEGLFSMKTLDKNGKVLQEEIFFNDGSKRVIKEAPPRELTAEEKRKQRYLEML